MDQQLWAQAAIAAIAVAGFATAVSISEIEDGKTDRACIAAGGEPGLTGRCDMGVKE